MAYQLSKNFNTISSQIKAPQTREQKINNTIIADANGGAMPDELYRITFSTIDNWVNDEGRDLNTLKGSIIDNAKRFGFIEDTVSQGTPTINNTNTSLTTPINIDSNPGQVLAPGQVYTFQGQTYTQPGGTTQASPAVGQGLNLVSGGNLQVGSSSAQVKQLQELLKANGANISADGVFGAQTQAAVKAYQSANGLTPDGIVGSKTNEALTKTKQPAPSNGVTTPEGLTSGTKITIPPVVPKADNATPFVAAITAAQNQAVKDAEAAQKKAQEEKDSLSNTISNLLDTSGGQGQATLDAEAAAGVNEKQAALNELNSQIQTKLAEYNALNVDAQGKAVTMNSIIGAQAQIKNVAASEIGLLQAQASAMEGKLKLAKDMADRAVELKYADIKTELEIRIEQLKLIQDDLTSKEKITADLLDRQYEQQKTALSTQVANDKDKNATLLNQMQQYPDAGITLNDTIESANTKITTRSKIYADKIRPPVGATTSTNPLSILDIARYNEIYPNAGIKAGDTEAVANAKVNATNSPEAQATAIITAAKNGGATYQSVVKELGTDKTSLDIAKKIYGITDTNTTTTTQSSPKLEFNPATKQIEEVVINPITGEKTFKPAASTLNIIDSISNTLFK